MKQDFFHKGNSAPFSVDLILIALALTSAKVTSLKPKGSILTKCIRAGGCLKTSALAPSGLEALN